MNRARATLQLASDFLHLHCTNLVCLETDNVGNPRNRPRYSHTTAETHASLCQAEPKSDLAHLTNGKRKTASSLENATSYPIALRTNFIRRRRERVALFDAGEVEMEDQSIPWLRHIPMTEQRAFLQLHTDVVKLQHFRGAIRLSIPPKDRISRTCVRRARLCGELASRDIDGCTGDKACHRRGQEGSDVRHFFSRAKTADRNAVERQAVHRGR